MDQQQWVKNAHEIFQVNGVMSTPIKSVAAYLFKLLYNLHFHTDVGYNIELCFEQTQC